jgi:hypothetical protein
MGEESRLGRFFVFIYVIFELCLLQLHEEFFLAQIEISRINSRSLLSKDNFRT